MLVPVLSGACGFGKVGHLENAATFSPVQFVIDNELARYVRHLIKGVEVTAHTLALEEVRRAGPGGEFMTSAHTLDHFRDEAFYSELFDHLPWDSARAAPDMVDKARARARAEELMDTDPETPHMPTYGSIFNNDINNILYSLDGAVSGPASYVGAVDAILDMRPGVLAQSVGLPEAVLYPSRVATTFDRHLVEVSRDTWPEADGQGAARQRDGLRALFDCGTDPLTLTIQACRRRAIPVVASFRMNAEDFYANTWRLSDFGRAHPEWRIPRRGNLDPAIPQVFEHRLEIFGEVAREYDIDGIELDFRRWYYMVSNPLENHPVLTRMVHQVRAMLDRLARERGGPRLILGTRVGPSLDSDPSPFLFPGISYPDKPTNASCRELGLDVRTWIDEGLLDYVCPSLFLPQLPGLPLTEEFAALTRDRETQLCPTLWPMSSWMHHVLGQERSVSLEAPDHSALALYRHDLCSAALRMYEDGADGISTYNWYAHLRSAGLRSGLNDGEGSCGAGADAVQSCLYPRLGDRRAIREYLAQPSAVPEEA